jgi:hypothetical protein
LLLRGVELGIWSLGVIYVSDAGFLQLFGGAERRGGRKYHVPDLDPLDLRSLPGLTMTEREQATSEMIPRPWI